MSMKVGTRIKRIRKSRGYTQKQVADALGITRSYVAQIETNRRRPNTPTLICLSDFLCVPITRLDPDFEFIILDKGRKYLEK